VDAIVAHELSHIRRGHAQQFRGALVAVPLVFAVSFVMPGFCLWAPLLLPIGFLATMAMRRRQEWIADADAAALTGGPEALIRGLARATGGRRLSLELGALGGTGAGASTHDGPLCRPGRHGGNADGADR